MFIHLIWIVALRSDASLFKHTTWDYKVGRKQIENIFGKIFCVCVCVNFTTYICTCSELDERKLELQECSKKDVFTKYSH